MPNNDKSLETINWDEFHPTSPYDVYVPRTPARKRWSILLGIVLYLVGQFSVSLFLPPLLIRAGIESSREFLSTASGVINAATFWLLNVANIVSVALIVGAVLGLYKEKIAALGLTTKKLPKALLYGVVGFVVAFIAAGIAGYPIAQQFGVDPTQQALAQSASVSGMLPLVLLSGVIIAPIAEEIVFRGYLYKAFRDRFRPSYAIVMSAALFSAIHLELLAAVPLFVIGVVLAYVYEKTGNLMAPITLHVLNNAVAFLFVR
ncbi:MAG TPA: type II CAAX endopeptidase family protein [Candidatus Bathyarchaeia archaeon]|nr:type II CAAX endopeptidase family protein [Candidatus Bathyarchaeia archaeon]